MTERYPKNGFRERKARTQQKAEDIIRNARLRARTITAQAQQQASQIRAQAIVNAGKVREQTRYQVHKVGSQARLAGENAARLFRINLANTLTLSNGVAGFLSILASVQQQYLFAALLILGGVVFDWLDGKAARLFSEESALGAQLDSLSDLVTFGIAPAVLVATIAPSFFSYGAGALFVLSSALRLGRFNVQDMKGVYFGVPTTTNGILLPLIIIAGFPAIAYPWYLVTMALLMNAPIRLKKIF
jgi:CDP-diacylglycerol---serine O-phosphatidyltransferase